MTSNGEAVVMPMIVQRVIGALAADPALVPLVAGRVSQTTPDPLVLPCVRVTRVGGQLTAECRVDTADVQVDVMASSTDEAAQIAAVVFAAVLRLPGVTLPDAVVSCVRQVGGTQFLDDVSRAEPIDRVVGTFAVSHRPA